MGTQGKLTIRFGQGRTIKNGTNTIFATSLAESETGGGGVRHDISPNGFGAVLGKTHAVWSNEIKKAVVGVRHEEQTDDAYTTLCLTILYDLPGLATT